MLIAFSRNWIVLGSVLVCVFFVGTQNKAEAAYGAGDALETIGIAAGIGTVIGLSTVSFYERPGDHLKNALLGGGAGMLLGLGIAAYLVATTPESEEIAPEELVVPGAVSPVKGSQNLLNRSHPISQSSKKVQKHISMPMNFDLISGPANLLARAELKYQIPTSEWAFLYRFVDLRF